MDNGTHIKALARLAQSKTKAAKNALKAELDEAIHKLAENSNYEVLEHSIEVVRTIGFRFDEVAVIALEKFFQTIEQRRIEYTADYERLGFDFSKYRNAQTLIGKGIEALSSLRYLQTPAVLRSLMLLSNHASDRISKDALSALSALAKYDISVFSGNEIRVGIGARPQLQIVDTLEKIEDALLVEQLRGVLTLLEGTLSSSMEGTVWSSTDVTLYRGVTPATPDLVAVRERSIAILCKLYEVVEEVRSKLYVLRVLNSAARAERQVEADPNYENMIAQSTLLVLAFYKELLPSASFQIVQKVEHNSYWIHFHSSRTDIRDSALEVKKIIDSNSEYEIYKTLIGFEGIFDDWASGDVRVLRGNDPENLRVSLATKFAQSINKDNFEEWRARVLNFAETESNDLATFPIFYHFLEEFSKNQPALGFQLLTENTEPLSRFVIPLLKGLWTGEIKDAAQQLLFKWVRDAQAGKEKLLLAGVRLFLSTEEINAPLLLAMFDKAVELSSVQALNQVAAVAIARYSTAGEMTKQLKELFMSCIKNLTKLKDAAWIQDIWFRTEAKKLLADLNKDEHLLVLDNLMLLSRVDYQAEEILVVMAEIVPAQVIHFFCSRTLLEERFYKETSSFDEFEAIPFDFHHLQEPLSKHPSEVVSIVLSFYRKDSTLFQFRGAKLLKNIFPKFSDEFEAELVQLIRKGDESDVEFVLGILSAYSGENFLHPLCQEVVKRLPSDSPLLRNVSVVLESTGVVWGEFGMADAYERKRLEMLGWLEDPDENIRTFARKFISNLELVRDSERRRTEEGLALRKFKYGES